MRKLKSTGVADYSPDAFLRFFGLALQRIQTEEDVESVIKDLSRIPSLCWRSELTDPQNPARCITLLHATLLAVVFLSPSNELRLLFLSQLIDITAYELWDIKPLVIDSSPHPNSIIFNVTPRECLFELCKEENGNMFYVLLSKSIAKMPVEKASEHVQHYIEFCKRVLLQKKEIISLNMANLLVSLSQFDLIDPELWFRPIGLPSDPEMGLVSLMMSKLNQLIKLFDRDISDINAVGVLSEFVNSSVCVVQRRNITYLIQIIYEIVKRSSPAHWNKQNPLSHLLGLVSAGSNHEIIIKIAQYVLCTVSREVIGYISAEKKESLSQQNELASIVAVLEGRDTPRIDLCDTLDLFSETLQKKSALLLLALSSSQYVSRLNQFSAEKILETELDTFSHFSSACWAERLTGHDCPPEFIGLTLLQAVILILIKKIPDFFLLNSALQRLVDSVPAALWERFDDDKKNTVDMQLKAVAACSPRRLVWNLCLHENGYLFLSTLFKILNNLPVERWQAEIPEYMKLTLKIFLKQGSELELIVAAFFSLLALRVSHQEFNWFEQVDLNVAEKQKRKVGARTAPLIVTPISVLIDELNSILKKTLYNPQICSILTITLQHIVDRSKAEDWDPILTMNGVNGNAPLNHLVKLLLDDSQNPYFEKMVKTVLEKATQESINDISRENREKLLAMPSFVKNKKLMTAASEKKPAPKKVSAVKVVPKPVAKKAVVSAPTASAKKPTGKKVLSNPRATTSVDLQKTNANTVVSEPVVSVLDQQLLMASVNTCQQNSPKNDDVDASDDDSAYINVPADLPPPKLKHSWADDFDAELNNPVPKKSVRYRHEPYSRFFNRKVIVKSDHSVTVSDVACIKQK